MRPVTVTVGPLASAATNNICTSQTPGAGTTLVLNGTLGASSFVGTGSISGNVLTITAVTSGVLQLGYALNGSGVLANTIIMGIGPNTTNGVGTYIVNVSQTVSSTTIYANTTITLDTPRRILLTPSGNESSNTFTITGTSWNNEKLTEVLAGGNATATYTNLDFATITQIVATSTAAGSLTVGTNGVASSMWVRFDEYALAPTAFQATVTGTVNYDIQYSIQESSPGTTLQPYQRIWYAAGVTGGTTTQAQTLAYAPVYGRITLNSGTGSVAATFSQYGAAPY